MSIEEREDQAPEPEEMTPEDAAGYEEEAAQEDVPAPAASGETPPPGVDDGLSEQAAESLDANACRPRVSDSARWCGPDGLPREAAESHGSR